MIEHIVPRSIGERRSESGRSTITVTPARLRSERASSTMRVHIVADNSATQVSLLREALTPRSG